MNHNNTYCQSPYKATRRQSRAIQIGNIRIGGNNPIRVQSMVNTPTLNIDATVKQCIELAEAGCEIIRITAQNVAAAQALQSIHKNFRAAGFENPLVADIHFLPKAAFEALEHVEKVRINPGNFADNKKFAVKEYSDAEYDRELERLYNEFTPFILRAKELGRAIRIGTNHGSLSDRIMNRYGDSPLGMVESALEFLRIAVTHNFHDICLSMKASNPKVMIQAYRLMVNRMDQENMHFPLHLGVTEAGNGEDARIKSAIGIGSLLLDGLGDTIRVSLTENPVYEIPVAFRLAKLAENLWSKAEANNASVNALSNEDDINPFTYTRRESIEIAHTCPQPISSNNFPRVFVKADIANNSPEAIAQEVCRIHAKFHENKIEGLCFQITDIESKLPAILSIQKILKDSVPYFILELSEAISLTDLSSYNFPEPTQWIFNIKFTDSPSLSPWIAFAKEKTNHLLAPEFPLDQAESIRDCIKQEQAAEKVIFTLSSTEKGIHATGMYRSLAQTLKDKDLKSPIWLRYTELNAFEEPENFLDHILISSTLLGNLLCDGIGDAISLDAIDSMEKSTLLAYNILQGSRLRFTKTEFVACPSCGRTLFDLESTTEKVRAKTHHLKGVTIAIMGCIVNGPGEMADADFGYVGGAPGKINLYKGKTCLKYNIPEDEAVDRLVDLIKQEGKWVEPLPITAE